MRMRLAMSRARNERITGELIEKTARAYEPGKPRPVRDALWGLYGLLIVVAGAAWDAAGDAAETLRERARKRNAKARRRAARKRRRT